MMNAKGLKRRLGSAKVRAMRPIRWVANGIRWGPSTLMRAPAVVGNAMPKAGSHLIGQVLLGLPQFGPFMFTPSNKLNRGPNHSKLTVAQTRSRIRGLMPGEVAYANLSAREEFTALLTAPGMATIYVYRDPRDLVVSRVFYATEMHAGHALHDYLAHSLKTLEKRLDLFILGQPELDLRSLRQRYDRHMGWFHHPEVLCIRFEDLILDRRPTLLGILRFIELRGFKPSVPEERCVDLMERAIAPQKSPTFRRGQPGNWKEYFSEQNKRHFKETTGDLLVRLGYEKNDDW